VLGGREGILTLGGQALACEPFTGMNSSPSSDTDFMGAELKNVKQAEPIRKSSYRTKKFS